MNNSSALAKTIKVGIVTDIAFTIATLPILPLSLQLFSIGYSIAKIGVNLIILQYLEEDEGLAPIPTIHPLLLF